MSSHELNIQYLVVGVACFAVELILKFLDPIITIVYATMDLFIESIGSGGTAKHILYWSLEPILWAEAVLGIIGIIAIFRFIYASIRFLRENIQYTRC